MKLVRKYDVMYKICDARETFGPAKIMRKHKDEWFTIRLPLLGGLNVLCGPKLLESLGLIALGFVTDYILDTMNYKFDQIDIQAEKANKLLKNLVDQLNYEHIDISFEQLLEAKETRRKYKIKFNEKRLPSLVEEKHILIPTQAQTNNASNIFILQEHTLGSSEWTLSDDTLQNQKKLVRNHA